MPCRPCAGLRVQYARAAIGRLALSRSSEELAGDAERKCTQLFGLLFPWLHIVSGGIPPHPRRQLQSIPQRRCYGNKVEMNAHCMRL